MIIREKYSIKDLQIYEHFSIPMMSIDMVSENSPINVLDWWKNLNLLLKYTNRVVNNNY
jgi:hypothetical protein